MKTFLSPFRAAMTFLVSYLLATPLTSHISLSLRETHWDNVMTYVFWLFSPLIWLGVILAAVCAVAGVVFVLAAIIDAFHAKKRAKSRLVAMQARAAGFVKSVTH